MSRTRQSLPPLYERESSSRLERSAVSVPILVAHVLPGGLSDRGYDAHLYFSNASSMILRLRRLCSCTALIRSVFGSAARNVSSRSWTWAHMMGSEGGSDCEIEDVFPNSSLETPASEELGISVQRHGRSYVEKAEHGGDWTRLEWGCAASNCVTSSMWALRAGQWDVCPAIHRLCSTAYAGGG